MANKQKTHLVIGLGEVGKALQTALGCDGEDIKNPQTLLDKYDILHICFPYSPQFAMSVKRYQALFSPQFTVIHSTVPIGTSKSLGVAHSPVRGKHPDLKDSMLTFITYVSGVGRHEIALDMMGYGFKITTVEDSDHTEAGKLVDLMQYGVSILLEKEIYKFCEKNALDFEVVYKHFNQTYNEGYVQMGAQNFIRPVLDHVPGKIGGHCVVQMMEYLPMESARKIISENTIL